MNTPCCPSCGNADLVSGTMQSTGTINFRPYDVKFMTFRTADISVSARMCGKCGCISLSGNLEKLKLIQGTDSLEAVTASRSAS